jgi:hypothetical protein
MACCVLSDHNRIKLDINRKKEYRKYIKYTNTWTFKWPIGHWRNCKEIWKKF